MRGERANGAALNRNVRDQCLGNSNQLRPNGAIGSAYLDLVNAKNVVIISLDMSET